MRNKTMFGELANYKDENFFNGNNLIKLNTKERLTLTKYSLALTRLPKSRL